MMYRCLIFGEATVSPPTGSTSGRAVRTGFTTGFVTRSQVLPGLVFALRRADLFEPSSFDGGAIFFQHCFIQSKNAFPCDSRGRRNELCQGVVNDWPIYWRDARKQMPESDHVVELGTADHFADGAASAIFEIETAKRPFELRSDLS